MITLGPSQQLLTPAAAVSSVKVFGVGNAGLALLEHLAREEGVPEGLVAVHTEARAVSSSSAPRKLQIGRDVAKGLGAGGDAARGRASASESLTELRAECTETELVIICAGLGGGTGSGAAPVLAEQARKAGALVIGVVTLPFAAEGSKRRALAEESLVRLGRHCLTVLCFENDRLAEVADAEAPLSEAFGAAAAQLSLAVRALVQMVASPAVLSVGLDELRHMFEGADARCHFGYGVGRGPDRVRAAVEEALASPLLEGGKLLTEPGQVLLHLTADASLSLTELQTALRQLAPHLGAETSLHVGVALDAAAGDQVGVAVLAATRSGVPLADLEEEEDFAVANESGASAADTPSTTESKPPKAAGRGRESSKKTDTGVEQAELPLDEAMRGRFKGLDPTMVDGQDLDIPTFIRMRMRLK
jgi:cell division protein FtsZ